VQESRCQQIVDGGAARLEITPRELASDIVSRHRDERMGARVRTRSAAATGDGLAIHLDETP